MQERSGAVVDYITTDARGVAASDPLPLGRYLVREVTAPAYYQLSDQTFDVTLEYAGQILKLAAYLDLCELEVLEPRYADDFTLKLLYEIINKETGHRVKLPEGVFDMTTAVHGIYEE